MKRKEFLKTCAQSGAACCALYAFNKKNQARYLAEPGAALRERKAGQGCS